jgi:hypothetical protein
MRLASIHAYPVKAAAGSTRATRSWSRGDWPATGAVGDVVEAAD